MTGRGDARGLSSIVAVLLIILMVLVAITILWLVLKKTTSNQMEYVDIQKEFFKENIDISYISVNPDFVNLYLKKTTGDLTVIKNESEGEEEDISDMDIISIVDISGSMCACNGISYNCCRNSLGGDYSSGNCYALNSNQNNACVSTCGGSWVDRLSYTKEANKELVKILSKSEGTRIGLVVYSTNVNTSAGIDLTGNINQLNSKIDSWQAGGSTCICCAINEARRKLQEQSSEDRIKRIIVMSDGEANVQCPEQNTRDAMKDAVKASCDAKISLTNLIIHSIGAGENVNEDALRNISVCGGGKYFSAMNINELIDVYRNVVKEIKISYKSNTNIAYLYIVFSTDTSSYREKIVDMPDPLVIENYQFNLTGKLEGEIKKVEIYPVILSSSGKEIIGPVYDSWQAS
jgi:hypothetical protein